jgi:LuxR family transcriptional regulator, maltose regulon positive regulatory protein
MGQTLQARETHSLHSITALATSADTGIAHGSRPRPVDRVTIANDHVTIANPHTDNVVPLFGARADPPAEDHALAGDGRSALALRGWMVHSLLLEAILRDDAGDAFASEEALERALALAEPDRVLLPFTVDPVPALLQQHPACRAAHPDLVADIFDVLSRYVPMSPPSRSETLLEPLTEGELRVLRYLPTNLSKREIAQEIYVSVHTIKTHMKHIYSKLDAHSRGEAVQRAREYGLIGRA